MKRLCWFFVLGFLVTHSLPADDRPNIVLIMTDDQGFGDFGFTGNPIIETPNLDALARRSVSIEEFYVSPVCTPTRASLMTGRYHLRTGAVDTYKGRAMMDTRETTLAEILREAGYATGIFGKWHLGDNYPMRPQDQGFDEVLVHRGGGIGQSSDPQGGEGKYTDAILFHNGEEVQTRGYCTDVYFESAMNWMSQVSAEKPFFAYIATNAPHSPLNDVPLSWYEHYKGKIHSADQFPGSRETGLAKEFDADRLSRVYAMVSNIDENLGRLIQGMEEAGLRKNTLFIFLSDNGPDRRRYRAGLSGKKTTTYEAGIRTPILFEYPSSLESPRTVPGRAAHIDLFPTLLDACLIPIPSNLEIDGVSVWPALLGIEDIPDDRSLFFQAHRGVPRLYHSFAHIHGNWKLIHPSPFHSESFEGEPDFELYDLATDPGETEDLALQYPDRIRTMAMEYRDWFETTAFSRPDPGLPPRIVLDAMREDPVVLTRQDGMFHEANQMRKESAAYWRLQTSENVTRTIRFTFDPLLQDGEAVLHVLGQEWRQTIPEKAAQVQFNDIRLPHGSFDVLGTIWQDGEAYGPWQIEISAQETNAFMP